MKVNGDIEVYQLTDTKHQETAQVTYHIQVSLNITVPNPSYSFGEYSQEETGLPARSVISNPSKA